MSEKTLGQVAFEAWSNETWEFNQGQHHRWERAAQAVVAELVADVRSPESKAALAVVGALLKAEGAAEERERLAKVFEDDPWERWDRYEVIDAIRGVKP